MDEKAFDEWTAEAIGAMATLRAALKSAGLNPDTDVAELNTLYEKGVRPFYFFAQEKGQQAAPAGGPRVHVLVRDGDERTYDRKADLAKDGLRWDKGRGGWSGEVSEGLLADMRRRYEKLNVTVG